MVSEAIIDCYDVSEQAMGLFNMVTENVILPFATIVLGLPVVVERIEFNDASEIVAVCAHGPKRQRISIIDLPLPSIRPKGSEWIDAYRLWSKGR
jgi:hypothetical protein